MPSGCELFRAKGRGASLLALSGTCCEPRHTMRETCASPAFQLLAERLC